MFYVPEFTGSFIQWFVIALVAMGPLFALNEAMGLFSLGYSKFAKQEQKYSVPSRVGMFIIYFPAVLLFPIMLWRHGIEWTPWHVTVTVLMSLPVAVWAIFFSLDHDRTGDEWRADRKAGRVAAVGDQWPPRRERGLLLLRVAEQRVLRSYH